MEKKFLICEVAARLIRNFVPLDFVRFLSPIPQQTVQVLTGVQVATNSATA